MSDHEVMDFVHRRRTPRVHHPLLVWHLGLWNPILPGSDAKDGQVETLHKKRRARAEAYAGRLSARIQTGLRGIEDYDAGIGTFRERDNSGGPHVYEFSLGAFRATVRLELGSEYMTITTLLDMSEPVGDECWHRCLPVVQEIVKGLRAFQSAVDTSESNLQDLMRSDFSRFATACFDGIWEEFGRDMLEVGTDAFRELGEPFADFRAVFLGDEINAVGESPEAYAHSLAAGLIAGASAPLPVGPEKPATRVQAPYWHIEESYRRDHLRPVAPDHWKDRFHILWPLMIAPVRGISLLDQEFTATLFDNSALHITAMGAQPSGAGLFASSSSGAPQRLYYGVYTSGMGGWAIGRLVNSLCELGTLRLAATMEIDGLRDASGPLRETEIALQQAFDKDLANHSEDNDAPEPPTEPLQVALKRAHQQKEIADQKVPSGGVAYRVERAIFYIRRFQQVLEGFKIKPYDDFQSYDKFVDAHHGSAFLYIERLHARYSRLMLDMRSLYQRMVAEEGRHRYSEIERIQKFAELISIAVLAPYYVGSVFAHMFWDSEHHMTRPWWIALFTIAAVLAVYYRTRNDPSPRTQIQRELVSWLLMAFAAAHIAHGFATAPPHIVNIEPLVSAATLIMTAAAIVLFRSKAMRRRPMASLAAALSLIAIAAAILLLPETFSIGLESHPQPNVAAPVKAASSH